METFADVLHNLIDGVFTGQFAARAHEIIDRASGTRTPQPESPAATAPVDTAPADPVVDSVPPTDPPTVTDPPDPGISNLPPQ